MAKRMIVVDCEFHKMLKKQAADMDISMVELTKRMAKEKKTYEFMY